MIHETEVAIVGGSLSGAALASHLGRLGIACTVIDKATFPREKACGEGLSRGGRRQLEALGLREPLGHAACPEIESFLLDYDAPSDLVTIPLPGMLRVTPVRRQSLDHALLESACRAPDVTVRSGARAHSAHFDGASWNLRCDGASMRAGVLVLADGGNGSLLAEATNTFGSTEDYGCTFHLRGAAPHGLTSVLIVAAGSVHAYCTPVEPNVLNVSILAPRAALSDFLRRAQHTRLFARIESRLGWRGVQESPPKGHGPFGARRALTCNEPALLLGDRLECLHPIGGMGMTHALLSAETAAHALKGFLRGGERWETSSRRYESVMSRRVRPLRVFTAAAARITKHPALGRAVAACARGLDRLRRGRIPLDSEEIAPPSRAIAG